MTKLVKLAAMLFLIATFCRADEKHSVTGMVVKVDQPNKTMVVSCDSIPGYMDAMVMPFATHKATDLDGLVPGSKVHFTLVVTKDSSYAENIEIRGYESVEQDPLIARRLKLLKQLSGANMVQALNTGELVPDFTLTDQNRNQVTFSKFNGKVVAINFIYTSCALPNFCYRSTNNFGVLQRRFKDQMGKDLILLTVTFDPKNDGPEALAKYAATWKADASTWHFLTGAIPEIQRVCGLFGVDYFPDEGLMNHSLHTAIIDRQGKLVANIEGNQFTAQQLGDVLQNVLDNRDTSAPKSPGM